MIRRILLAYPPSRPMIREDRCPQLIGSGVLAPALPPTDLLYLAAIAEQQGCECLVRDYSREGGTKTDFVNDLLLFRPDCLVLNATTPTLDTDLSLCETAKELLPGVLTIAKGAHFLRYSLETMERHPRLDMIIRGESEETFRDIVRGGEQAGVPGLVWRGPAGAVLNPDRPFLDDLDSLPFPSRHLIDNRRYMRPDTRQPLGIIKVSRGCPYHCFYCLATPVSGRVVRKRSPANILAEVRQCVEQHGIRHFIFWADHFTFDGRWVLDLCKTFINADLGITWSANARADTIDREMVQAMKRAGCKAVSIGIESGSQDILDRTGKGITLGRIRQAVRLLKDAQLTTLGYFLFGLPWETRESSEETIRFSLELDCDYANFFIAAPFPGTRYYEYALKNDWLDIHGSDHAALFGGAFCSTIVPGHNLSGAEIDEIRRSAFRQFYGRPSYVMRQLMRVRSMQQLSSTIKAGLTILVSNES